MYNHPLLKLREKDQAEAEIEPFSDRRWSFPRGDSTHGGPKFDGISGAGNSTREESAMEHSLEQSVMKHK